MYQQQYQQQYQQGQGNYPPQQENNYVASGKFQPGRFGQRHFISFSAADLQKMMNHLNGDGWVTIEMKDRRQVSPSGASQYGEILVPNQGGYHSAPPPQGQGNYQGQQRNVPPSRPAYGNNQGQSNYPPPQPQCGYHSAPPQPQGGYHSAPPPQGQAYPPRQGQYDNGGFDAPPQPQGQGNYPPQQQSTDNPPPPDWVQNGEMEHTYTREELGMPPVNQ